MRALLFASALVLAATCGCAREVDVHLTAAEISRLPRHPAKWPEGVAIRTETQETIKTTARVARWTSDHGVQWTWSYPRTFSSLARSPSETDRRLFEHPTDGRWTLELDDDTPLTKAGVLTTQIGAGITAAALGALFFTAALLVGPEPSYDPDEVFLVEGILAIPPATAALVGLALVIAGNTKFRSLPSWLGEGKLVGLPPRSP